jgi:RluA family pseudouridine synthase
LLLSAPNPRKKQALGAELYYQDSSLAVLYKPAGLLSAPSLDEDEDHALKAASRLCRGPRRPKVVHRLDKETSGLLVFARTLPSTRIMREAIDHKRVIRKYRCLVVGRPTPDEGMITSMLLRNAGEGKRGSAKGTLKRYPPDAKPQMPQGEDVRGAWAITKYKVVAFADGISALEIEILTGRTHQIRIHLSEIRHPIIGEWVYAKARDKAPRLALHAAQLTFKHPFAESVLHFEAPWPDDLRGLEPVPTYWYDKQVPNPNALFLSDIELPEP